MILIIYSTSVLYNEAGIANNQSYYQSAYTIDYMASFKRATVLDSELTRELPFSSYSQH